MQAKVYDMVINSLVPNVAAEYQHLVPSSLIPERIEFKLDNVNNAIANAIKRTAETECFVRGLYCTWTDIESDDDFIVHEMIAKRISCIPIDNTTPLGAVFKIYYKNDGFKMCSVKANNIKLDREASDKNINNFELKCNWQHDVCYLNESKYLQINNIRVVQECGFSKNYGMLCFAINAASVPIDEIPLSYDRSVGVSSMTSKAKTFKISFNTNGVLPVKQIMQRVCDSLIQRLQNIKNIINTIEENNKIYVFRIAGESHTIGNLLMRSLCEETDLTVTYECPNNERTVILTINTSKDIHELYTTHIEQLIEIYKKIKTFF